MLIGSWRPTAASQLIGIVTAKLMAERASQPYKHTARFHRKERYRELLSTAVHFIDAARRNMFKSLSLFTANCLRHHGPAAGSEMRS
jgi:CBS-domain-containing membrane protein